MLFLKSDCNLHVILTPANPKRIKFMFAVQQAVLIYVLNLRFAADADRKK